MTLLAGVASSGSAAAAQEERPQITPGERKAPRKKDAEPRAVAVLKLSSDGKVSLVPIAILINGKFWDAGSYKASPVPMALEPGTVYEAERTGSSSGLFTVSTALHSNAANAPIPWLATGAWAPLGSDTEKKTLQAEPVPVGLDTSDGPPRLTKNPTASSAPSSTASVPGSSTPSPSSSAPAPAPSSGDEPPRLSRPATQTAPPSTQPTSTGSTSPQSDSKDTSASNTSSSNQAGSSQPASNPAGTKPAASPDSSKSDSKSDNGKPDAKADAPKAPASDSGADEANRPRLRRGKPATSFADQDIPGYSKPGARPVAEHGVVLSVNAANPATPAKSAPALTVQLIPAISDSAGPEPHSYGFEWLKGEEAERRQQLVVLAQEQVRAYVDGQAKARIAPKTVAPKTAASPASHHVPTRKLAPPVLSNVQMTAYDLWSNNQPVVIFSAQAQLPSAPRATSAAAQGTSPAPADALQYSVVLVAYPDIYNNFHKLYAGVTDKYHLDLTPRLELVDAVDADGDGRGELLFSETSDAGTGWVIYRATADKLWKMYDSLNPE